MKFRAVYLILLLALVSVVLAGSGCATDEPANDSVRPWNAPQSWEGGVGGMQDYQHR
ncbi:MAG TPA: hypothetical protein VGO57_14950 [Verrucomicrobiae bacterium]|jgi:hypothetical protein